jgi:YfiH family protein
VISQPAPVTEPAQSVRNGVSWLRYAEFDFPDVLHGIAVFKDLDAGGDRSRWVEEISQHVSEALEVAPRRIVIPLQTHSRTICQILADSPACPSGPCDGLITDQSHIAIGITVADCIPLFAVNRPGHAGGIAHCGWRGIAAGIVEEFAGRLAGLTERRSETRYLIGASIGPCCYEVGDDLLGNFAADEACANSITRNGKVFFDLKGVVASRLVALGVDPGQISIDKTCTSCKKYTLSSFRASGTESGRMLAVIMFTR